MIRIKEIENETYIIDVSKTSIEVIRELSNLPLIIFSAKKMEFSLPTYYSLELKVLLSHIKLKYNMASQFERSD